MKDTGSDDARHWGWTTVLLTTVVVGIVSTLQKLPCLRGRVDTDVLATRQCYSDAPLFYLGRGLAADFGWLGHPPDGYRNLEYPPVINLFIEAVGKATHLVMGIPEDELDRRAGLSADALYNTPSAGTEELVFFLISSLGVLLATCVVVRVVWSARWRAGDALTWLVLLPLVLLTLTVNWDAIAIAFSVLALRAWDRSHWRTFGVWVALGTATKLFPLVLLAAALILLARDRRIRPMVGATTAFVLAWLTANAPLYLSNPVAWAEFWHTNSDRPASFGSVWIAARMVGVPTTSTQLTVVLLVAMIGIWVVCGVLTLRRTIDPTIAELSLAFLLVFFIVGKVFSPQYSLWVVLALVLVSRSRWLIASVAVFETFHYVATWLYIRGITTPDEGIDKTYWLSITMRLSVEGLAVVVVLYGARRRAVRRRALHPDGPIVHAGQ